MSRRSLTKTGPARIIGMTSTEMARAREDARNKTTGKFGKLIKVDPGTQVVGVSRYTDEQGVVWISGNPVDPRPAANEAFGEAQRITAAGDVAWVKTRTVGDNVEFEVRAFDNPFDAYQQAEDQGCSASEQISDLAVDHYDPDDPGRTIRLYFPDFDV